VQYEDLTGDYTNLPFSAARMSRIAHRKRIDGWRWRTVIPQFCDPVWRWAMEAAAIMGMVRDEYTPAMWTPPREPFIDPDKEGLASMRNIRSGLQTWSETVRELGYDPKEVLDEYEADNEQFDEREIVFDSDPRKVTQQGQMQSDKSQGGTNGSEGGATGKPSSDSGDGAADGGDDAQGAARSHSRRGKRRTPKRSTPKG